MDFTSSPAYLQSADLHNIASGTTSFFDDPATALESGVEATGNFIAKTPAFAVSSIASGINSIYNSGVVAANFFGISDAKENDLQQTLGSYDSSLGDYYGAHKEAADLGGFIATSFVPGIGGVKLMNTGQRMLSGAMKTGSLGRTLAESTGLITTRLADGKTLGTIAGEGLALGQQTFTVANAGVIKALAGGVTQAALDSFAFESMVQATMFRSPILEDQDIRDIGSNILAATVFGGAIGGALNSAKVYGEVKTALTSKDVQLFPYRNKTATYGITDASDRMVIRAMDLHNTPAEVDALTGALKINKITSIRNDIRLGFHDLVGNKEVEFGNQLADLTESLGGDQIANIVGGAKSISRAGAYELTPSEGHSVAYVKLHGLAEEGVGDISFSTLRKSDMNIADMTAPVAGETIKDTILRKITNNSFTGKRIFNEKNVWHMESATSSHEVEARYIWADKLAKYSDGMAIGESDIPLLEGAIKSGLGKVELVTTEGERFSLSGTDLKEYLYQAKHRIASELELAKRHTGWGFGVGADSGENVSSLTSREIAKAVNVSLSALESETGEGVSMFARQDAQKAYTEYRAANGITHGEGDLDFIPKHAAVVYDATRANGVTTDVANAMIHAEYAAKIVKGKTDKATAKLFGEMNDRFPGITKGEIAAANRYGAGAGIVTSANGDYGTLASKVEAIGKATSDLIEQVKSGTRASLDSIALRLRSDQAGAIELSKLNDLRNSTTEAYVLNDAKDGLILKSVKEANSKIASGEEAVKMPKAQEGVPIEVKFVNSNAADAVRADIEVNGKRVGHVKELRAAEGSEYSVNGDVFYGWKPDPKSMPFFAFVKDTTITGEAAGHTSMIHAASAPELESMIANVRSRTGFSVYTKEDTKQFFEARKAYEFDRTLHENYIDSSLKSAGVNNQFFPKTDQNAIVDEWLQHHSTRDTSLARDAVAVRYGNEFEQLRTLGAQYTGIASSQYAKTVKAIESTVKNPFNDYIKTAMNISRLNEYPLLASVNRGLEEATGAVVQRLVDAWAEVKTTPQLDHINNLLDKAGISHAYKNAAEVVLANHSAPKPYLSNFIRQANAILANTFLRLDFLNPIVNAISAQVLLGSETSNATRKAMRSVDIAGVTVPGTADSILSPVRMIAKANADFLSSTPELDKAFKHMSLTTTMRDQMKSVLDDLSLRGAENPAQLQGRITSALSKATSLGGKITGNDLAEEYNRFVSAHVAQQIAGVMIKQGALDADGIGAFMNTFVNRTQTNTLASQRPLLFQGPVGQAIGLFQSFQFNTMQQLFRYVAEGSAKDAGMMMGLQGTIFGLNGLPGFQYMNQHIIGTASGNPNHTDAYSSLYGAAGKTAGDWLMYGIPSNMLQTNLYSRGDINPRTLTIVPVAPQDVVAVSAFSKFAGDLKDTTAKIAGGGDVWQSVLQGLEHNGLSRPLAGMAQTLQAAKTGKVFSTSSKGDISFVNDFASLATLSRLAGGKPLDEALVNDQMARQLVYKAADTKRMQLATETFKTTVVGDVNGTATDSAVHNYMGDFVKNGGRAEEFNKNMLNSMTTVNTPTANKIIDAMKGAKSIQMKNLMGGRVEELQGQPE